MFGDDVGVVAGGRVPEDREGHREELERDCPLDRFLGSVAGVSDAEDLFAFFEGDFDWPAVGVALDDLRGG